jgi:hypothetical protein
LLRCGSLFVIASLSPGLVPERWWSGMVNIVLIRPDNDVPIA